MACLLVCCWFRNSTAGSPVLPTVKPRSNYIAPVSIRREALRFLGIAKDELYFTKEQQRLMEEQKQRELENQKVPAWLLGDSSYGATNR